MRQLLWLRSDLRVHDNRALSAAMSAGPTVALYLVSPGQWQAHDDAPCKIDFWRRNLLELAGELAQLNVPLLVRRVDTWRQAPQAISALCERLQIGSVQANEEYGVNETRRDQAVDQALQRLGVAFRRHLDQLLLPPGSVLTRSGGYFQVFSQFRKVCLQRLLDRSPALQPKPRAQAPLPLASDPLPAAFDGLPGVDAALAAYWPAGEAVASARLQDFIDTQIDDYHAQRDLPARPGTSQLSAYLACGVLSPRQCLGAALNANQGELDSGRQGVATWINELLWREFYKHILVGFPRVSQHRAFRAETEALPWRDAPDELAAWQQGRTGFPLIDAAMRQLLATGWMHNRLRMLVAMFLSKHLLLDWRAGERWFMQHLIDGDLAANNGGWQWSASTGTDAVPYFRLFNPISQSQRFDPHGRFIRHWLPELAALSERDIHNPAALGGLLAPPGYPAPIVDLGVGRTRALQAFRDLPRH
ncbi:deoxyribodipyrimidine photo-lyase [Pseudomonas sp. UL073]|uniref:Deoxyribodipyrimidine photo-lyase n=1 Tax=Zestomonas insulae TaxID=2809017 RepID=A0ABS2IBY6_9GAMM|nr:deoxyribodipyrimidine photo-lyase [Pseudomonas insulae]MBM7060178.1 deoxyribodipyrimidine photo-lyase [Pseudomonas insulae]